MKMKKFTLAIFALSLALPLAAQAQGRLTEAQLMQFARDRGVCGDREVASAFYINDTEDRVAVRCSSKTAIAPFSGGLGNGAGVVAALAGIALIAAAAGGGGSTSDTQ